MIDTANRACLVLALLLLLAVGCSVDAPPEDPAAGAGDPETLAVYSVNYPLRYFAERIGGQRVQAEFPAPPDVDPAFWSPDGATLAAYQQADLVLLNGAGYARWVQRVSLPASRLVDTSAAVSERYVRTEEAVTHAHGPQGEHAHGDLAFTTWLDLTLALEQARAIERALAAARPDRATDFGSGLAALEGDLLGLDGRLREMTAGHSDLPLLGSHPVYQYLAQGYGLNLRSVHFEPDEYPEEQSWRELRALLEEHPAGWMLWEDEPLRRTADALRELGVESLVYAPCGNVPRSGDLLDVMRRNVADLAQVF